jgi:hypothetical protein
MYVSRQAGFINLAAVVFALVIMGTFTGCMSWQPNWPSGELVAPAPDAGVLLQAADQRAAVADSRESLQAAMDAYRRVLDRDPYHVRALTELSNQIILMGAAHTDNRQAKNAYYRTAMRLCERAMYTNPDFKAIADQGRPPWEACQVLGEKDIPAMIFWTTAVLYIFKEVLSFPEQVVNITWVERTGPFLERIETIDPEWGGGAIQFTQSLYFGILPAVMGGDADRSGQYLKEAVAFGSPWMLSRWGRAKYFHVRDQDRQGFEEDLRWVLRQDVAATGEAYCWRAYFRQDARGALENVDRYF